MVRALGLETDMKILVMPGGDFGPGEQHKVVQALEALRAVGATRWAVQAVMPKKLPPSKFLGPGATERLERIVWLTERRVEEIGFGNPSSTLPAVEGIVTDYEYEPLGDLNPNEHGAAVSAVSREVGAQSLYAIGTDRHSKRAAEKLVVASSYPWLCIPQFHYARNGGQPHDPTADIALARDLGVEVVPYVQGLIWFNGEATEVPVPQLREQFKSLAGEGITRAVAWCTIKKPGFVQSVGRVLEAAEGVA